jgi:hypothetical protein
MSGWRDVVSTREAVCNRTGTELFGSALALRTKEEPARMKVLTERAMDFLTKSEPAFACYQPWMSDLLSSLIRAGFYESYPDADPDYQLLILTPFGRRTVQSIKCAREGSAKVNVITLEARRGKCLARGPAARHVLLSQKCLALTPHRCSFRRV